MATTKPRLTITLEPHTHLVISTLAGLQGYSKSKVITDLLDAVVPVLERTARLLQMAETAQTTVTRDMKNSFEESEKKLHTMLNMAMSELVQLEETISKSEDDSSETAHSVADDGSRSETQPPYSNRGVRSKPTLDSNHGNEQKNPLKTNQLDLENLNTKKVSEH
tara:strand:- start:1225 stop:1719 length:495 start_codon:yes stop_codon:yes gene_type:complete